MLSYWEKQSFQTYDHIIVGAGLVGLSTAISLKEKNPNHSIAVIEKGIVPTGASTRNAGFACFGSPSELVSDIQKSGSDLALSIVERRWKGLELLRKRLGDDRILYQNHGGYELISKSESYVLERLPELNDWLSPLFNKPVFVEQKERISHFGFDPDYFQTAVFNSFEGQLHTGQLVRAMLEYGYHLGIHVFTGTEVYQWEEHHDHLSIFTRSGWNKMHFKATSGAFCTNAFSKSLIPSLELNPGRGLVILTEPLPDLAFKGTFHFDEGFYYFRNINDRVLLGGGRNQDLIAEETTDFGVNENIRKHLVYLLEEVILGRSVKIEMEWSGIMAFGQSKEPIVKRVSDRLVVGARMGGMGVAMATLIGSELCDLIHEG